jgi:hypothetical protein
MLQYSQRSVITMGVFEKAIPRYTYDPVQKLTVQPVQDYYVDDIFDPIFNRNVRNALTQKYGNPLLGTVMGYYEGIENALFGQNDKWGILGPGMGILSGFGRSMDKAGDVILGTLTEGVKGVTGQGFENPLENIFAEDQDYTGRRALAAVANSMRGLAGGTTVSEEDFGGAWGLPSLAIELTTDPSILGGNLTKIANNSNILPQLASAKNGMGKVGEFLQKYDDVMAKASIDLTAPGLRPAIKALIAKVPIRRNFATKFTDTTREIPQEVINDIETVERADPNIPETVVAAKEAQTRLRNNPDVVQAAETVDVLEKTLQQADSAVPDTAQVTDVPKAEYSPAYNRMRRLRAAVLADLSSQAELGKRVVQRAAENLDAMRKIASDQESRVAAAYEEAFAVAKRHGAKVGVPSQYADELDEIYQKNVETFDKLRKADPDLSWEDFMETGIFRGMPELNPEYADTFDVSPEAWDSGIFSANDSDNKRIVNHILGQYKTYSDRELLPYFISSSEIGFTRPMLKTGNAYVHDVLNYVFGSFMGRGIPKFTNSFELKRAFKVGDFADWFAKAIPDEKRRNEAIQIIDDLLFPPSANRKAIRAMRDATRVDPLAGAGISEWASKNREYHYYKQVERLSEILRKDTSSWMTADDNAPLAVLLRELAVQDPEFLQTLPDNVDNVFTAKNVFSRIRTPKNFRTQHVAQALAKQGVDYYQYLQDVSTTGASSIVVPNRVYIYDTPNVKNLSGKDMIRRRINLKPQITKDLKALEDARQEVLGQVYKYNGPVEYQFLRKLQQGFDDIRKNYIQPMRGQLPHSDQMDVGFSIDDVIKGGKGAGDDSVETYASRIVDPDSGNTLGFRKSATDEIAYTPVRGKDPRTQVSSEYAYISELLRELQRTVRENPEIYGPTNPAWAKNLGELYYPVREFAQVKMRDGTPLHSFDIDTEGYRVFQTKVLPAVKDRLKKGKFPWMSKAQRYQNPELYDLLYYFDSPHRKALEEVLFKKDGKYYIDELAPVHKVYYYDRFRQPLLATSEVKYRMNAVKLQDFMATNRRAFTERYGVPKNQAESALSTAQAQVVAEAPPKVVAEMVSNPPTAAESAVTQALEPVAEVVEQISKGVPEATVEKTVSKKIWHWFTQIRKAIATPLRAIGLEIDEKTGERIGRASLRTKRAEEVMSRAKKLISEDGINQGEVRKVLGLLTAQQGDVLKGTEFVDEICKEGMVRSAFRTKDAASAASKTLQANVNTFNAAVGHDVLQLLERKMSNGNYEVIVTFNTKNKKLVKQIAAAKKNLNSATFMDTEFLKAYTLTTEQAEFLRSEKAQKIISYLEEVDTLAKDQARTLGFTFDDTAIHTKHVRDVNPETADYVANDLNNGIDLDALEEATTLLSNTDAFRAQYKGALGARLRGRRYRGAYWNYDTAKASLFTYDLEKFAKGSLGDGMFANSNYQSFVDLFVNDNFKIKGVFEDVDDFRKFMYQGGADGRYAGNLKNIDLCYAKYDADGRFVGIHKYNVYSDADLAKALANPDTILVPANVVDTLDKVIRKELRLSNKAYAFINKHFTIPFKFGVLTNPGFLLGNVSDAYMKQAVTMSEKYGTSVSAELAKVGEAATMYLNLGNKFNAAIEKWQLDMEKLGFELTATEKVPEILAGHAASRKRLTEYVNGTLIGPDGNLVQSMLTDDEAGVILLWTKLQQLQHTSNSLREFDDVADAIGKSEFDVPRHIVDRVTQGSGKYSWKKPSTWGVFINNPVTNSAMNASEFIENTMRGTAILNDLMHEGYSNEDIFRILLDGSKSPEAAAAKLTFDVDFADAVNAMYESNFNYERMSDFMEGVGKVMPFPTFFLKNLAYWLELFEKNPQFFDHAITVHENMWAGRDTSEDEFLAEAKGRGAVPVGGQKLSNFFKGIYKPTPLQSMFGAFNLINEPVENLSYRLHPLISGSAQAVNQALPHSPLTTFLGEAKYRPYSTDIYERNVKQDDENFNSLAYAMHRSNPFERTISTALRTPKKVAEGQAQLSDFLPSIFQPDFSKK